MIDEEAMALSKPAEGSAGKTGTWRVQKPIVDYDKCTRCKICIIFCPENTIDQRADTAPDIDYNYCKGCGVCANLCPVKAIVMVDEVK
ncbi:MAG: 4Fe-4S binding protein [Candidatus Micrarchaeaceae archaeon]